MTKRPDTNIASFFEQGGAATGGLLGRKRKAEAGNRADDAAAVPAAPPKSRRSTSRRPQAKREPAAAAAPPTARGAEPVAPIPRSRRPSLEGAPVRVDIRLAPEVFSYLRDISRPVHTGAQRYLGGRVVATELLHAAIEILQDNGADLRDVGDDRHRLRQRLSQALRDSQDT